MTNFVYLLILILSSFELAQSQIYFRGETIRDNLINEIRKRVGEDAEISVPPSIQDFAFQDKNVEYLFDFGSADGRKLNGNFMVGIEFRNSQKLLRRVEVPARVKIYRSLLVASRTINQGEEITAENTFIKRMILPPNIEEEDCIPEELFGKNALHSIVRGSVITRKVVAEPFAIRRGEKVRIVVLSKTISIMANGTALQDARAGEPVRCLRDGSRSVLLGIAAKDGTIIITN